MLINIKTTLMLLGKIEIIDFFDKNAWHIFVEYVRCNQDMNLNDF